MISLGVDKAYSIDTLDTHLPELLMGKYAIYYSPRRYPAWEKRVLDAWQIIKGQARRGVTAPEAFCDLAPVLWRHAFI